MSKHTQEMKAELDPKFEEVIKSQKLPGVSAIVLDAAGNELYSGAFGSLEFGQDQPLTLDSKLMIWSCTKLITCLAALQLMEQGKIALDDPVEKYLPEIADERLLNGFNDDGSPKFRSANTKMKVIHLFTHTAGYTYDFWSKPLLDFTTYNGNDPGTYLAGSSEYHFTQPLEVDPGTAYNYGINIDKLGFIVEKVSGKPLQDYLDDNIFKPLGLKSTGTHPYAEDLHDFFKLHMKDPATGTLTPVPTFQPSQSPPHFGGGHYLVSTIREYPQILLALLNGGAHPTSGARILKEETVSDCVFKDFIGPLGVDPSPIGEISASNPGIASLAGSMFPSGTKRGWSCGLMLNLEDLPGRRKAGSGAWAGLGNLHYWVDRTGGKIGMIATEVLPFMDPDLWYLFGELEKAAYA